jgi:hypothetical protein
VHSTTEPTDLPGWALPTQVVLDVPGALAVAIVQPREDTDAATTRTLNARTATNLTGECPECGARVPLPNRAQRRKARAFGSLRVRVQHAADCPAGDPLVPEPNDALAAQLAGPAR